MFEHYHCLSIPITVFWATPDRVKKGFSFLVLTEIFFPTLLTWMPYDLMPVHQFLTFLSMSFSDICYYSYDNKNQCYFYPKVQIIVGGRALILPHFIFNSHPARKKKKSFSTLFIEYLIATTSRRSHPSLFQNHLRVCLVYLPIQLVIVEW